MRNLLTMALLLLCQFVWAQAPGYMGKRLLITGEASFFNALFNPDHNMNSGLSKFGFNIRSTFDLDYVVARNGSIGLTFDLIFSGMEYEWAASKFESHLVPDIGVSFTHGQIRGYGYGVNYKVFRNPAKGGIAPIGGYTKFDVMLLDLRVRPYDREAGLSHGHEEQFFSPMLSITVGQQRIFFNTLVLRTGVQLGIVPGGIVPYFERMDGNIDKPTQRDDLRAHAEARLFSYYLLNFNVGVGFLAPIRKRYR
ncbi:MAG: hypothetical protein K9J06_11370 [Flavobacteriales bacterium]|nr:hypothetical protein [Flavobacteriales bacterium]